MGPKRGVQRKNLIGDALWIGRAGAKKKFNIYILCDAVVFGIEI
jgi:hypothetical protein